MSKILSIFEKAIIIVLIIMMALVLLLATIDLGYVLLANILSPPCLTSGYQGDTRDIRAISTGLDRPRTLGDNQGIYCGKHNTRSGCVHGRPYHHRPRSYRNGHT